MQLTKAEIDAILRVIDESYPIQRKRSGEWAKPIADALVSSRDKLRVEETRLHISEPSWKR